MPSLQNVLDRFRIVLVPYIGSANPSLCLKRIIWSFIQTMPFIKFIKLFIIIGKLFLWDCRRSQTLPKIQGLKSKLKIKYETEKHFLNFVLDYESRWRFLILPFEFGSLPILFTACALFMYQTRSPFFILFFTAR